MFHVQNEFMQSYLDRPTGEDDVSIQQHVEWMQEEKKNRARRPDNAKIETLMGRTFADRRHLIVNGAEISEILSKYPWLAECDEVIYQFNPNKCFCYCDE